MTSDDRRTIRDPQTRPASPAWRRLLGRCLIVAELAATVGMRPSSVHYQLRELETKGAIVREPGTARDTPPLPGPRAAEEPGLYVLSTRRPGAVSGPS